MVSSSTLVVLLVVWLLLLLIPFLVAVTQLYRLYRAPTPSPPAVTASARNLVTPSPQAKYLLQPDTSCKYGQSGGSSVRFIVCVQGCLLALSIAALAVDKWSTRPMSDNDGWAQLGFHDEWRLGLFGVYAPVTNSLKTYSSQCQTSTSDGELDCINHIGSGLAVFISTLFAIFFGLVSLKYLVNVACDGSVAAYRSLTTAAGLLWICQLSQTLLLLSSTMIWSIVVHTLDTSSRPSTSFILFVISTSLSFVALISLRRCLEHLPPNITGPRSTLKATKSMFNANAIASQIAPIAPTSRLGAPTIIPTIDGFKLRPPPARSSLSYSHHHKNNSKQFRTSISLVATPHQSPHNRSTIASPSNATSHNSVPLLSVPPSAHSVTSTTTPTPTLTSTTPTNQAHHLDHGELPPSPNMSQRTVSSVDNISSATVSSWNHPPAVSPFTEIDRDGGPASAASSTVVPNRWCSKCGRGDSNPKASVCAECGNTVLL